MGTRTKKTEAEVEAVVQTTDMQETNSLAGRIPKDTQKYKIRNLVSGIYDIQKLRISTGNRIVQSFNIQMGQEPSTKQEDMDEQIKKMLDMLRQEYSRITDAYIESGKEGSLKKFIKSQESGLEYIKTELDYKMIDTYEQLVKTEETMTTVLKNEVHAHPLWDAFFVNVKGCGELMAGCCIAYFDITKARHVSSFWKFAGLDTVDVVKEDGTIVNEGRAMKHAKFTEITYVDKNGIEKTKHGLGYNPTLKAKLCGVLGSCLLKAGLRSIKDENGEYVLDANGKKQQIASSIYVEAFLDYKKRLDNRADSKELTEPHKFAMANRYMVKQFVRDLWVAWMKLLQEQNPDLDIQITGPYEVDKLGYNPHKFNQFHAKSATSQSVAM